MADLRPFFAYAGSMTRSLLRNEIGHLNIARAAQYNAEMTYGTVPAVIYCEDEAGEHGNFLPAAYRRIACNAQWKARLKKVYTGSRFVPRRGDRRRGELECANSSDALLMNIFCYPGVLRRNAVCSLLAIDPGAQPAFGVRPAIPLKNGARDRSEIDMKLGSLLIEAKLTEGDFQAARCDLVHRYRDLEEVFDVSRLPMSKEKFRSCQLIRGALAAHALRAGFCVLCDRRRPDLIEDCFEVFSAVESAELRCRLSVVTWQELAVTLPAKVKTFLAGKYGIVPTP
ncbi:MAG: hypothetical protein WA510_33350 [Acidobacteriaceae bacterium]